MSYIVKLEDLPPRLDSLEPILDKIVEGDCLDLMRRMPDGCVDAVITDPPYGIDFDRATWSDKPKDYGKLIKALVGEATRISSGACFVWQANPNAGKWHEWFPEGFRLFAACKGFVQFRPTPIQWSWDAIVWWGEPTTKPSVYQKDYFIQRLAPFGSGRERISHPCPRPIQLVEYITSIALREQQIILDPFLGSGTTAVAAKKLGRRFIGCEINPDYCKIAERRLLAIDAQPGLSRSVSDDPQQARLEG